MRTSRYSIIILVCCALLAVAGCKPKSDGRSDISTGSGGRNFVISADARAFVQAQEDGFTVKLTGHEIMIDKERVLAEKGEAAKVPAGAKTFEVNFTDGTLTVGGDGAELLKMPLAK